MSLRVSVALGKDDDGSDDDDDGGEPPELPARARERRASELRGHIAASALSLARRRWQWACSSVLAFMLPLGELRGRYCLRPEADLALLVNPTFVALLPLLSPVLHIQLDDNELTRNMDTTARAAATQQVMGLALRTKLAGTRCALVLEDCHDMDGASWALLREIQATMSPLLLLLTTRPLAEADRPAALREVAADGEAAAADGVSRHMLELGGLAEEEVRQLLCETLRVEALPDSIPPLIAQKTSGVPFWVIEFARQLREAKVVTIEEGGGGPGSTGGGGGTCVLAKDLATVEWPATVTALITTRIDRLPATEEMILKVASVLDDATFARSMVVHLMRELGVDPGGRRVGLALRSLCANGMLVPSEGLGGAELYAYAHAYLHDVAASLLPLELRLKLHVAAAHFYEERRCDVLRVLHAEQAAKHEWSSARREAAGRSARRGAKQRSGGRGVVRRRQRGGGGGQATYPGTGVRSRVGADGPPLEKNAASVAVAAAETHAAGLSMLGAMAEQEEEELLWKLQHHWSAAVDAGGDDVAYARAIDYLALRADRLMRTSIGEAWQTLEKADAYCVRRAALRPLRGPVLLRLGQCQVLAACFDEGRASLEAAIVELGGESAPLSAPGGGEARHFRRFVALCMLLACRRGRMPPLAMALVDHHHAMADHATELGAAYAMLAQLSMRDQRRWRAAFCAARALDLGLRQPTLTPLVARSYALLFLLASDAQWPRW